MFRKKIGDDFDRYYAFEPFPRSYEELVKAVDADPRIQCWNIAVWNKSADLSFVLPTGNEHFCPTVSRDQAGPNRLKADSLDHILGDQPVTIITMDVEGAEPEVLEGAVGIIRKQRPALAISTYHLTGNGSQLWDIPLWIRNLDLGYSLYCRHYSPHLGETVCYAVPK